MNRSRSIPGLLLNVATLYLRRTPRAIAIGACALAVGATGLVLRDVSRRHRALTVHTHAVSFPSYDAFASARGPGDVTSALLYRLRAEIPEFRGTAAPAVSLSIAPTVAWNGNGYGVAWVDFRDRRAEIYFARLDREGVRQGNDVRVTNVDSVKLDPRVVWTGHEYGVTWTDERDRQLETYFARVSPDGALQGQTVRLSAGGAFHFGARLAWNGSEFGVGFYRFAPPTHLSAQFARVTGAGERVGTPRDVANNILPTGALDFVWTGEEWALAFNDFDPLANRSNLDLYRLSADGAPGAATYLAQTASANGAVVLAPARIAVGAVWENDLLQERHALSFASATRAGIEVPARAITDRASDAVNPSLVANGDGFGLAWQDDRGGDFDVYVARLDARGVVRGQPLRLTEARGEARAPSIAWSGEEYGVVWQDTREAGVAIYFARVGPGGAKRGPDRKVSTR